MFLKTAECAGEANCVFQKLDEGSAVIYFRARLKGSSLITVRRSLKRFARSAESTADSSGMGKGRNGAARWYVTSLSTSKLAVGSIDFKRLITVCVAVFKRASEVNLVLHSGHSAMNGGFSTASLW